MNKEINQIQFSGEKLFFHSDRVSQWVNGKKSFPVTFEMALTDKCNHDCLECSGGRQGDCSMSISDSRKIINQISEYGRSVIFTGGGEPFCSDVILESIEYAKFKGMDIGVITNGGLLNEEICSVVAKYCSWIRFSVDAGNSVEYSKVHNVSAKEFDIVLKNIDNMIKERDGSKSDCMIGAAYLTSNETKHGIKDFFSIARNYKVDFVQFRPYNDDNVNVIQEIEKYGQDDMIRTYYPRHKYLSFDENSCKAEYGECDAHNFVATVAANCKMYICCHHIGNEKYCLGDLKKQSLEELWVSDKRMIAMRNIELSKCPTNCRNDSLNRKLWMIKTTKVHGRDINFL